MLYIEKKPCPPDIQADIDLQLTTPGWDEIAEQPSPKEAKRIRKEYFDMLNKERLRAALIEEQHGLCAYCMSRIVNDGNITTLEHWYPLSKSKSRSMQYSNLLAVCKGGSKVPLEAGEKRIVCCDAKKEHTVITINPQNKDMMSHIAYHEDGTVFYSTSDQKLKKTMEDDLSIHLGLNGFNGHDTTSRIVKKRSDVFKIMDEELMRLYLDGELTHEYLMEQLDEYENDLQRKEFAGVAIFVLQQYLQYFQVD